MIFSPSRKRGVWMLLALIVLFFVIKTAYVRWLNVSPASFAIPFPFEVKNDTLRILVNQADSATWEKLPGIGAKLSSRIVRYRDKIGGFTSLDDIQKVYGITPETFEKINPFLVLDTVGWVRKKQFTTQNAQYEVAVIEINTASAADFAQLPGIGTVLSERIVKFREAKKGFTSIEDIAKVYGIEATVFEKIKPYLKLEVGPQSQTLTQSAVFPPKPDTIYKKKVLTTESIDINTASQEALQTLPGVGEKLALKIIEMRTNLGYIAKVEYVSHIYGFSPENFAKARPLMKISPQNIAKKNLNLIQWKGLIVYPFMNSATCTALINSRKLGGYFKTWDEVAKVEGVTPEMVQDLQIYFELK